VVSVTGLFKDRSKGYGTAGLIISGLTCSLWMLALVFR
jgi:hypothetical protein